MDSAILAALRRLPRRQREVVTLRIFLDLDRLTLPAPGPAAAGRPWPVRASDFDPAGHVNNAVHWQAAEDLPAGLV